MKKLPPSYVAVVNGCYDSPNLKRQQVKLKVIEPHDVVDDKAVQVSEMSSQTIKFDVDRSQDSNNTNFNNAIFNSQNNLVDYEENRVYFMNSQSETQQVCILKLL